MKVTNISTALAKKLIVKAQLLDDNIQLPLGKDGILTVIKKLGYVQIDTIAVIKRAHHHVLWTRCSDYKEEELHELQAKDSQVFEYWGHAMSYLPISDYRYALPKMRNFKNPRSPWAQYQFQKCRDLLQPILRRIRDEGPLSSSDFNAPTGKRGEGWWDWKPAKVALELLFWRGELMIRERQNFQKIYDLTERVLPAETNTTLPTADEISDYLVHRSITALGIAEEKEILKFMQPESGRDADLQIVSREQISSSLQKLVDSKVLISLKIAELKNTIYYAFQHMPENIDLGIEDSLRIKLLSPFDNLIIQRNRLKRLFGFDYALECYLPAKKRRYGYFSLPILWGNNFVGRLDPKADLKSKTLIIKNLIFEPGFTVKDEFLYPFVEMVMAFTRFNQCERFHIENVSSKKLKAKINSMVLNQ